LHFGIVSPLYKSSSNAVTLALTGSWGTSKYMQTYYGVSASQSAASGFTRYDAGSGIYAWSTNIDWTYKINQDWSVITEAGFTQLTGDARNSPIVQRKTSPTGSEGDIPFLIAVRGAFPANLWLCNLNEFFRAVPAQMTGARRRCAVSKGRAE
jgi:hypothetical protein